MKVELVACAPPVNESERRAANRLETGLISRPGDARWVLFTNVLFSARPEQQPDEIDIVAVGPPGVRIIEVKHWTASWAKRHPEIVEREADRVTMKARRLGTTLRQSVPGLDFVAGVFLVTETAARVRELVRSGPVRGVPVIPLHKWPDAVALDDPTSLTPGEIEVLVHQLERRQRRVPTGPLHRVAGYTSLVPLPSPESPFHRIFRGVHASRKDRVILHLYDLSAGGDPKRPERQWSFLHRLQEYRWAPRIVDSLQDVPGHDGEAAFFTLADSEAPGLNERAADRAWGTAARIEFAGRAVKALGQFLGVAEAGGGLRNPGPLTHDAIRVHDDRGPIFAGLAGSYPLSTSAPRPGERAPRATPGDDAPGTGIAKVERDEPTVVKELVESLIGLFEERSDSASRSATRILARGRRSQASREGLVSIRKGLQRLAAKESARPPVPLAESWTDGQEVSSGGCRYRIVSRLGRGADAPSFRVVELHAQSGAELGSFVARVARDEARGTALRNAHARAHSLPDHDGLAPIAAVAPEWKPGEFVTLAPWIEGEPLREYDGLLAIHAEEIGDPSTEALVTRWLERLALALDVMHRNGLVHGAVNPDHIIVSGDDVVLTGFDSVTRIGGDGRESAESAPLTPGDDFRGLAEAFSLVLRQDDPDPRGGEEDRPGPGVDTASFPVVAPFLERAMDPDPSQRFRSAAEVLGSLRPARPEPIPLPVTRTQNRVEWLRRLLESYPGSRWGNRETRGLDSDFAARTYVPTELEDSLHQDIEERRARLVILCGNAGDGKTALLQHLVMRLGLEGSSSAQRTLEVRLPDGGTVRMNLDGSASWEGRSANDLLDEFLAPFQEGAPDEDIVHLLAVNDGRLLEWISDYETHHHGHPTPLTEALTNAIEEGEAPDASHIRFVNLNHRSLVGSSQTDGTGAPRFLDGLVDALYGGARAEDIWRPCQTCSAQERCEVFRAARVFGPAPLAPEEVRAQARKRLYDALRAVHLRGETHITIRELRGALVYILFGTEDCSDYHASDRPVARWAGYGERAFAPESAARQGEVLRELVQFDPALESDAELDRTLWRTHLAHRSGGEWIRLGSDELGTLRRWAWFGITASADGTPSLVDHAPVALAGGANLSRFEALARPGSHQDAVRDLCAGISRLQLLPSAALKRDGVVPLPITPRTPTETAFWVEKRLDSFRVEPVLPRTGDGAGRLHRQARLLYRYGDGREEELRLGAGLFHLLLELSDGYQLGDVATDGTFAQLSIFVRRILQEDERTIMAWNPMREDAIYRVSAAVEEASGQPLQLLRITPVGGGARFGEVR